MSEQIKEARLRRRSARKPKRSQIPYGLMVTAMLVAVGFYLSTVSYELVVFWIFGIAFGYVLQRSRFCFGAAFRDPILTRSTSVTRGILVAFAVGTIGFSAIKLRPVLDGASENLNMMDVAPIGLPLIFGGILFGIGMVIAGGCASGGLMRIGEGFSMQGIVLFFFVVGSLLGVRHIEFWDRLNENAPEVFLPDLFGWFGALIVQFAIIGLLYVAAVKWQEKKDKN